MSGAGFVPGSFRDPAGFVFERRGRIFRQVNSVFEKEFTRLEASGLLAQLEAGGLVIPSMRSDEAPPTPSLAFAVLEHPRIPFISHPYEWTFSQLKAAALLTLDLQQRCLEAGFTIKDATARNVQFIAGKGPIWIDVLSIEPRAPGTPWMAYRQFCEHFLAPLALMAYRDVRLGRLLSLHPDGIPLDLAVSLLPLRTRFRAGLFLHLHAHAGTQSRGETLDLRPRAITDAQAIALVRNLRSTVRKLRAPHGSLAWSKYNEDSPYETAASLRKQEVVRSYVKQVHPAVVWDLGANAGTYSRIAAETASLVVALEADGLVADACFRESLAHPVLPVVQDLSNPSCDAGWAQEERAGLSARGPADLVLALALVHHLAIGNQVPFSRLVEWLSALAPRLVVEFVGPLDPQVKRLMRHREASFAWYAKTPFLEAFGHRYRILQEEAIPGMDRTLYLMERLP